MLDVMEDISIVNLKDQVVWRKTRAAVEGRDIYRVTALWVCNRAGDVLLARRAPGKRQSPGRWGPTVTGTVEYRESYRDNMEREVREELGVIERNAKIWFKELVRMETSYFLQWFRAEWERGDRVFTLREAEVAELQWFCYDELKTLLRLRPGLFISAVSRGLQRELLERGEGRIGSEGRTVAIRSPARGIDDGEVEV
jgi:isopentenyldiphosphate isomerase